MKKERITDGMRAWIDARKRHHLSHAQVQMARELGMNPKRLGGIDNHRQEPWKLPLPVFIEELYRKRFGRAQPEYVLSIEEQARQQEKKRAAKREAKLHCRQASAEVEGTVRAVDPDMSSERGSEHIGQPAAAARLPEAEEGRPSPYDPGADSADADG